MQAAAASLEAGTASGVESPAHATPLQSGNGVRVRVSALLGVHKMAADDCAGSLLAESQHEVLEPMSVSWVQNLALPEPAQSGNWQ